MIFMSNTPLKNRHHLRKKDAKKALNDFGVLLGIDIGTFWGKDIEMADADEYQLFILKNVVVGFAQDDFIYISVRGLLTLGEELKNAGKYITVDKGAVKFVSNGADIMVPGIIDADPDIVKDDFVWIREETHLKPLAVGQALMNASDMRTSNSGKAVKTIHYVGDKLWNMEI